MKKKVTCQLSDFKKAITSENHFISVGASEKYIYVDKKPTDKLDSVILTAISEDLGEVQFIFAPRDGLANELNTKINFAEKFSIKDIGNVTDVRISIYNGAFSIKFFMEDF